jgi:hypothetical protein
MNAAERREMRCCNDTHEQRVADDSAQHTFTGVITMTKTIAKLITSRQMKSLSTLTSNRQLAIESSMLSEDECAEKLRAYDKQWKSVEQRIGHKIDPVAFQIATNCALHECPREQLQQRMQDVFDADDAARNAEPTHEEKREALRIEALQGNVIMPQSHDYDGLVELCKRAARAQCAERQMINADGMDFEPLRRMASRAFDFLTAMQKAEAVKFDSEEQADGERNFTRDELNANAARRAEQRAAAKFSAEERALNTASKIGGRNAAMAHDQRDDEDYATPQHVFVAYYQNVIDTANEYRVDVDEAVAAYVAHYDKLSK